MNVKQLSYQESNDDSIKEFKQNRAPERESQLGSVTMSLVLSDNLKTKRREKNRKKKRNAYLDHSYLSVASEPTINNSDRKPLLTRLVPTSDYSSISTGDARDVPAAPMKTYAEQATYP
ncbi:hypothetical protein Zmor_026005 [Zophobas morio]|uniref:Uncharacterized protein n=1 Tax=Zophobas morio TaxID=2755281 RepID=A0AA38M4R4_9CUCU|nr:hypothetical protein Zmor_026005 [Zophobas morio]